MVRSLKAISVFVSLLMGGAFAFTASPINTAGSRTTSTTPFVRLWGTSLHQRDTVVMMPATIEKEGLKTGGSGPAVLERPDTQVNEPTKERKHAGSEAWEVRIYNDGLNTREHVARSLVQVTGMSEINAYQTMMQAHQNGIAVVGRWVYEVAEMYHQSLKERGIVSDIVPVDEDT